MEEEGRITEDVRGGAVVVKAAVMEVEGRVGGAKGADAGILEDAQWSATVWRRTKGKERWGERRSVSKAKDERGSLRHIGSEAMKPQRLGMKERS